MILGRTHMIVRTGPLTSLAPQITGTMNVKPVLAGGQTGKLCDHPNTARNRFEGHLAVDGAGSKYSNCKNRHSDCSYTCF